MGKVWIVVNIDEWPDGIYDNEEAAQKHAAADRYDPDVVEYELQSEFSGKVENPHHTTGPTGVVAQGDRKVVGSIVRGDGVVEGDYYDRPVVPALVPGTRVVRSSAPKAPRK